MLCDEHGIGGDGEYCGDNDAQLDRINVLTTRPRVVSTYHARCSSIPARSTLFALRRSSGTSVRETS
jgi:hypothetical protein